MNARFLGAAELTENSALSSLLFAFSSTGVLRA